MSDNAQTADTTPSRAAVALGVLGWIALPAALLALHPYQLNIVTYRAERVAIPWHGPSTLFLLVACAFPALLSAWNRIRRASWNNAGQNTPAGVIDPLSPHRRGPGGFRAANMLAAASPLSLAALPLAWTLFVDGAPPFAATWWLVALSAWAASRAATMLRTSAPSDGTPFGASRAADRIGLAAIIVLIALAVVVHVQIQRNFFEHFLLGHADMGNYAEELKNCLAGRGLRSDSAPYTRLGWHFVPLYYALAPGYAAWPTPIYLMTCGAILTHLPALLVYVGVRRMTGSAVIAFAWAMAWMLQPSISRGVYANTYGFQWTLASLPLTTWMIFAGMSRRRGCESIAAGLTLLVEETKAAAVFGWGLCTALFGRGRRQGWIIAAIALVYGWLCVTVLIPWFAGGAPYARGSLFGDLGPGMGDLARSVLTRPSDVLARLFRPEGLYLVLMLIVPLAGLPLRGWRIGLAAVPGGLLILLIQNAEYMSVKFWHHATILPFVFLAALAGSCRHSSSDEPDVGPDRRTFGIDPVRLDRAWLGRCTAAVLMGTALAHFFFGFSPISHAYAMYAATHALHVTDPRWPTVQRLREMIPRDRAILATERLAAHFTDYRRIYTGIDLRDAEFVIIDTSDRWDRSGLSGSVDRLQGDSMFAPWHSAGPIVVFQRRSEAWIPWSGE